MPYAVSAIGNIESAAAATVRVSGEKRALTGLRGVAACLVMLYHFTSGRIGGPIVQHGYMAVDLFFVLSGYVMALTYGAAFLTRGGWGTYQDFLGRRLARIYPLYLLMTLVMAMLAYGGVIDTGEHVSLLSEMANLILIQAWGIGASFNPAAWSISTEWAAYLSFPVLAAVFLRTSPRAGLMLGLASSVLLACLSLVPDGLRGSNAASLGRTVGPLNISDGGTPWPLLRCLIEFGLGLLTWRLTQWPSFAQAARTVAPTMAIIAVIGLLAVHGSDVLLVVAFIPLVGLLSFEHSFAAKILAWRPVHWLGDASYAIYLLHWVMIACIGPLSAILTRSGVPHGWTISVGIMSGVTVAASSALYIWFEKPAKLFARRLVQLCHPITLGSEAQPTFRA